MFYACFRFRHSNTDNHKHTVFKDIIPQTLLTIAIFCSFENPNRKHIIPPLNANNTTTTPPSPWSQAQNREKILKDRNNTSSHSFQTTALFQTSAPVSVSRDPDCVPYWNDQVADWSKKLLLPTETGCRFVFKLNGTKIVVLSEDNPADE